MVVLAQPATSAAVTSRAVPSPAPDVAVISEGPATNSAGFSVVMDREGTIVVRMANHARLMLAPSESPQTASGSSAPLLAGSQPSAAPAPASGTRTPAALPPVARPAHIAKALATELYADLERAGALGDLPAGHCRKSASFGFTTVVEYAGSTSPDLQCAQNPIERKLNEDLSAIVRAAKAAVSTPTDQRRHTQPIMINRMPPGSR